MNIDGSETRLTSVYSEQNDPKRVASACPQAVPYDERFLEASWCWLQDEEIQRLTMTPAFDRDQQRSWFARLQGRTDYLIWGIELDGDPVGAFGIKSIRDDTGEYWGYIGEKGCWGRGIGKWMVDTAVARARELKLNRLTLRVSRENTRAIRLYLSQGFASHNQDGQVIWMERVV